MRSVSNVPYGMKAFLRASKGLCSNVGESTSMERSSSIFTTLPKMKMYCMILANSQVFRSLSSFVGSKAGCDASISSRPRFLEPIMTGSFQRQVNLSVVRTKSSPRKDTLQVISR